MCILTIIKYDQYGNKLWYRKDWWSHDAGKKQILMTKFDSTKKLMDGTRCEVISGKYVGKSGLVKDIKKSKTGYVTITVLQENGERFKTLAKNVVIEK